MICSLYVSGAPEMRRTLQAVTEASAGLRRAGVEIRVVRIRDADLACARVVAALRAKRVTSLPALFVSGRPLVGTAAIRRFCDEVCAPAARAASPRGAPRPASPRGAPRPSRDVEPQRHDAEPRESDPDADADAAAADLHEYLSREIRGSGESESLEDI
ncbi:MAG: hypothetical protein WC700_04170 [Gemmatimonadaceae bacterium]|jgi:hypothetical protein